MASPAKSQQKQALRRISALEHHANWQERDWKGRFISEVQADLADYQHEVWLARVRAGKARARTAVRDELGQFLPGARPGPPIE